MYDFTSTLTTIAACSASIVAILGGLIASKLLALNAEREESNTRLSEIDEEISFYKEERDKIQATLDEDDALDFIRDNIESLIERKKLDSIYQAENWPSIEKETLKPYWQHALDLISLLYAAVNEPNCELNDDRIPVSVVAKLNSHFEYLICQEVMQHFERRQGYVAALSAITAQTGGGLWYQKAQEQVTKNQTKIDLLELQRKQLIIRHDALKHPKGVTLGLCVFALFSAVNIIFPLSITPFRTDDYIQYAKVKVLAIGLFIFGLLAIFLYLIYLFHWEVKCDIKNN